MPTATVDLHPKRALHGFFFSTRWKGNAYLISPFFDFMMVGGGALLALLAVMILLPRDYDFHSQKSGVYALFLWLAFIVNDPHFMISYQQLYTGYRTKLQGFSEQRAMWWRYAGAGIIVPLVLSAGLGYAAYNAVAHRHYEWIAYGNAIMLFFVGWHYMKQAFGVFMMLSALRSTYYDIWQRRILLWNSYAVWVFAWGFSSLASPQIGFDKYGAFSGMSPIKALLPAWPADLLLVVVCLSASAVFGVLLYAWLKQGKRCSLIALTGYLSMYYLIALLPWMHPTWLIIAPFFHSLQYLMFVMAYQRGRFRKDMAIQDITPDAKEAAYVMKRLQGRYERFFGLAFVLGLMSFFVIPSMIDLWVHRIDNLLPAAIFVTVFTIFINIHHYFIDNVIWRRENSEVGEYLFKWSR